MGGPSDGIERAAAIETESLWRALASEADYIIGVSLDLDIGVDGSAIV